MPSSGLALLSLLYLNGRREKKNRQPAAVWLVLLSNSQKLAGKHSIGNLCLFQLLLNNVCHTSVQIRINFLPPFEKISITFRKFEPPDKVSFFAGNAQKSSVQWEQRQQQQQQQQLLCRLLDPDHWTRWKNLSEVHQS